MRKVNWHARGQRFRKMAAECRAYARDWPDPDIATNLANAASELDTAANATTLRSRVWPSRDHHPGDNQ